MTIERILNRLEKLELASLPNIRKGDRIIVNSESTKNPEIWVGTVHRVKRDKSLFRCIFDDDFWMDMPITNSGTGLLGFASTLRKRKSPIPMEGIASWVDQDKWMTNWLRKQIPVEDKIPKSNKSAKPVPQSKAKIIAMKMSSVLTREGHNSSIEPKKWFYTSGKPSIVDTLKSLCKMFDLKLKKSKETAPPTNYSMGEYQIYDVYEGNEFMFHLSIGVVNPVVDKSKPDGGRNNKVQSANRHPDSSTQTTPIVAKVIHNLTPELIYKASRVTRGFQTLEVWTKNKKQLDSMITFFKEHNYYLSNNGNSQFIGLYNTINGQPGDHLATLVIYINDLPVLDSTKIMRLPKFGSDREVDVVKTLANFKKVLPQALFRSNISGNEVILDRTQPQYSTAKQLFGSFKRFCQDYQIPCEVVDNYQMEIKLGGKKMGVRLGPVPDSGKYIKGGEEDTVKEKDKNDKVDMRKLKEFLKYFGQDIRDPILNAIKKGEVYVVRYNIARKDVDKTAGLQENTYEDASRLGFDYSLNPDSKGIHYLSYKGKRLIGFKWYK